MQLQHHQEALFGQMQTLQAHRSKEKDQAALIPGSKTALARLKGHIRGKMDQKLLKQHEFIYNQVQTRCNISGETLLSIALLFTLTI